MTPRTLIGIALGCLSLALGGCDGTAVEEVETAAAITVTVEAARVETLKSAIDVTGIVVPAPGADWTITAPEPARIAELPKAEGDAVRPGDLLVRFDIPSLPAELAAKRADLAQAEARLTTAESQVKRLSNLYDRGVAALREVEEARREQAEAAAAAAQARSAIDAASTLADRAVVMASFPGVVAKRWHNPGDFADASTSDPVLRVIDPQRLQVVAAVPVAQIARIVPGRACRVIGPAGGDGADATVVSAPVAIEPGSITADVRLSLAAPAGLAAGTMVRVVIMAEERPQALVVPAASVVHDGDETFVMLAGSDNKAHKRPVHVGLVAGDRVEIVSGLSAGDSAIVQGQDGLPDGAAITIQKP